MARAGCSVACRQDSAEGPPALIKCPAKDIKNALTRRRFHRADETGVESIDMAESGRISVVDGDERVALGGEPISGVAQITTVGGAEAVEFPTGVIVANCNGERLSGKSDACKSEEREFVNINGSLLVISK